MISMALRIASLVVFLLVIFGASFSVPMIPLGLALWVGSTLV